MKRSIKRSFKKLEKEIRDAFDEYNEVDIKYIPEKNIMNVEINATGFLVHFSYDEEEVDQFQFLFDRGVHPAVVAHLINIAVPIIGKLYILEPYFIMDDERFTGIDAEVMYDQWVTERAMETINIIDDLDGEIIH